MPSPSSLPALLAQLHALLGERISVAEAVRAHHGHDESCHPDALPDAVVWPQSTAEVSTIAQLCSQHGVPMIPYGAGSSVEGHTLAIHGGISIDLSQMNRVVAVHEADLTATVEAGVTRLQLNRELRHSGLFFPIDPGADATLGGMPYRRTVTSVMMASVPSEPTSKRVRSYPADDLRARLPVCTISPLASTAVSASTFSRMVP